MTPAAFQTRRALKMLNIAGVGLSLAAIVAVVFGLLAAPEIGFASAGPTLVIGALWAWILRWPRTIGRTSFRWAWLASLPLAALNAALAGGLWLSTEDHGRQPELGRFAMGALAGASFGAIFWVPALVATLVCFGLPIARSQRLARLGLAGAERGEWIVGGVCALVGTLTVLGTLLPFRATTPPGPGFLPATRLLALLGLAAGAAAAALARTREARRRRFVAAVEAGRVQGFRVDTAPEGKVLLRVVALGQGYRVADFEEEVAMLDAQGQATRVQGA